MVCPNCHNPCEIIEFGGIDSDDGCLFTFRGSSCCRESMEPEDMEDEVYAGDVLDAEDGVDVEDGPRW